MALKLAVMTQNPAALNSDLKWAQRNIPPSADECENRVEGDFNLNTLPEMYYLTEVSSVAFIKDRCSMVRWTLQSSIVRLHMTPDIWFDVGYSTVSLNSVFMCFMTKTV